MTMPPALLLCLPLVCSGMPHIQAADAPPLIEISFEEGDPGTVPEGWTRMFTEPNTARLTADEAHSGKQSLHLLDTSLTLACSLRSPRVPVEGGAGYLVTAWHKAAPDKGGSLYIEFWDASGKRLEKEKLTILRGEATGNWERMRAAVEAPEEAVGLTLLPSCWSGGLCDAYYDDLRVIAGDFEMIERKALPPASVQHPCGLYKAADIARARENLQRHQWARDLLQSLREQARFWLELPEDQLSFWIPAETPMRVMDCPRCGANWDYAWKFLSPDRLECTRCGLVLPDPAYPEDKSDTHVNPVGQKVEITYYQDAEGEKYPISAQLRYRRIERLGSVGALGKVYALTGERAYAEKAVPILRRIAEVYPGYLPHDWNRVYRDYGNLQSGKLSGWKLHDERTFLQLALCYDLIYNSGVLTEDDKTLIENGAFRECALLLTSTSPKGCCINDGPYAMSCGAMLGAILGDHDTVKWAVDHADGFRAFIKRYFFRDGHWEDGSFSYESMALGPLYACPEILHGYSDPPTYEGADRYDNLDLLSDPLLAKIYVAPLTVLTPQRTGPPISDSAFGATYARRHAETNYHWYPTKGSRRLLAHVYDGKFGQTGDEYALFRRDPEADLSQVEPLDPAARSLVRPGVGWAILRTGPGPDAAAVYLKYGVYGSGHGHPDKLNFLYYDRGAELISDQGYLGARHEISPWNRSTLCHNVVMFDGKAQVREAGELLAFMGGGLCQTILGRGEKAAPPATRYERSLSLVDHGIGKRYLVDVVRAEGGSQQDFVIHGAGQDFTIEVADWVPFEGPVCEPAAEGGKWLRSAHTGVARGDVVTAAWAEQGKGVRIEHFTDPGTQLLHVTAPGQRNRSNPWEQRDLHLLVARRPGPTNVFVSVLQSFDEPAEQPLTVRPVAVAGGSDAVRALEVSGRDFTDLIVVGDAAGADALTACGDRLQFRGEQAFLSTSAVGTTVTLMNGSELLAGGIRIAAGPRLHGKVLAVDQQHFSIDVDCPDLPEGDAAAGQYLLMTGLADGAYEIEAIAHRGDRTVVTLADEPTIRLEIGQEFTYTTFVQATLDAEGKLTWRANVACEVELVR